MAYNDFVTNINNADTDAQALSAFMQHPATAIIPRRIAGSIKPLDYYLGFLHGLELVYSQVDGFVNVNGTQVKTVTQAIKDAINTAGVQNGVNANLVVYNNRTQADRNNERISVKDLGVKGDGTTDDTTAINNALTNYRNVFIPAGDYVVTAINVPANTSITTAGFKTRFIQKTGTAQGTRILNIVGSNVNVLPSVSFKGNIATDTNEQNHAVYIQANSNTGDISNVNIGDIFAQDIRGDAVYFGQATGATYKLSNVNIGNVSFDNVYRNGVSVVSCNGFSVKSIIGTRVGMQDIDIEANINSGQCKNGTIGFVKGKCIGGIAQSVNDYVDNVIFDRVELSYTNYVNSNPEYPSYYKTPVLFRNSRNMEINQLIIDGCEGYAIQRVEGDASLANTTLRIGKLTLRNCCNVSNSENGLIKATNVVIDYLELDFNGLTGRSLFYASNDCIVYKADVTFADTCNFFRASSNSLIEKLKTKSTTVGVIFNGSNNCRASLANANVDRLFSYSNKCSVLDSTITANLLYTSGNDTHAVINSTLNNNYYMFGTLANSYTSPMVFGAMSMWFDSTGKLRAKSSAPTSDTDGEVVGTQGLKATVSYDPPSLATAAQQSTTVTLNGAVVGNAVAVSHSQPLQGTRMWAEVTAANTVTVYHRNDTGATVDVANGNLVVKII